MRNPKILVLERDPDLINQVRGVASELRPRPEVVPCDRPGLVGDLLSEDGPFDVLVAGPSLGTKSGLNRLQVIHDEIPTMSLVLAFAQRPDAQLRDIVRTGAVDLLQLPTADRMLRDTLERAIGLSRPAPAPVPAVATTNGSAQHATVFTIASATGGCGKTFFATNLAYFLAHHTGKRTCLVDLDLQFGEVSTALRLRPRYSIADLLSREDEDGDLAAHFTEYTVNHDTGVVVLPAPKDPSDADRIHPTDVTKVLQAARAKFDYVVVDTPAQLSEVVLAAFDLSDSLYVMATMDLPSVRNMGVFLNTLDKLKIPSDNVNLILNKAERDVGIDVEQITKLFPQGFSAVLPYAREVSKSVNVGTPILAFSPQSEVSRKLASGLTPILPEDSRFRVPAATTAQKRGFFSRMFKPVLHPTES
ncbi:MAG: AAA family ATPase [Actinobacteria bacterium]|nr:AAA family ATPase [Actinomycetota bacterium]